MARERKHKETRTSYAIVGEGISCFRSIRPNTITRLLDCGIVVLLSTSSKFSIDENHYSKPLEYEGELYLEEHLKLTTEKAGFQVVKAPANKSKLVLAID